MSNIEITADNIKKFAKRLQKNTKEKGFNLSLSESQELLAKTLGSNNYNALIKSIESSLNLLKKQDEKNHINNVVEKTENRNQTSSSSEVIDFSNLLKEIVNLPDNKISMCYFQKEHISTAKNKYTLYFSSIYGDTFKFEFGRSGFSDVLYEHIVLAGLSNYDADNIIKLICSPKKDILNNRFDSITFAKELFEFLGDKKETHVIKIDCSINDSYTKIDGEYYSISKAKVSKRCFESIQFTSWYSNDKNYFDISGINIEINTDYHSKENIEITRFHNVETPRKVLLLNDWSGRLLDIQNLTPV